MPHRLLPDVVLSHLTLPFFACLVAAAPPSLAPSRRSALRIAAAATATAAAAAAEHNRAQSRISLLQHKIALLATKTGSVVLLEGLPGSGKTEALSVFAARTMPRTALIHFTAASPYHASKSFGGWSMVLQQYLDSLHKLEVNRRGISAAVLCDGTILSFLSAGEGKNGVGSQPHA